MGTRFTLFVRRILEARIERGIARLQKFRPDWLEHIREQYVLMDSAEYCMLGQLYGDYGLGWRALKLSPHRSVLHGFDAGFVLKRLIGIEETYNLLEKIWIEKIERLKQKRLKESQTTLPLQYKMAA